MRPKEPFERAMARGAGEGSEDHSLPGPACAEYLAGKEPLQIPSRVLGVINFAGGQPIEGAPVPVFEIPMRALGEMNTEVWPSSQPVERGERGAIRFAGNGEILIASVVLAERGGLEATSFRAYAELLALIEETGYRHPLRAWNYMAGINEEESGLERYRCFCAGRYEAFARHGFGFEHDLPAASAVGHHGRGLYVTLLAAREGGLQVENPRQVNAWSYPSRYGPRSPSFARATLKRWAGEWHLYVAGTASITGHESRHRGDAEAQFEETKRNLAAVEGVARERIAAAGDTVRVAGGLARIYLRNAGDLAAVAALASVHFGAETRVLMLDADICRRELLVEIELIRRFRIVTAEP